jgi:Na+-translocating ferredoxin:NAD+ oxidoreductase RnfC subunit
VKSGIEMTLLNVSALRYVCPAQIRLVQYIDTGKIFMLN